MREAVEEYKPEFVLQYEQLGTGHAVRQARASIAEAAGPVMVLCADTPLLTGATLKEVVELHQKSRAAVTLITAKVDNPFGYGRVVRGKSGIMRIVEEKDATAAQKKIREVNAGIYCFEKKFLIGSLEGLGKNNAQGEYYLPDTVALAKKKKRRVSAFASENVDEVMGVNTRHDLSRAEAVLRDRITRKWMLDGVTMLDPASTFIGDEVILGRDTVLYGNVRLEGKTRIGEACTVFPGSRIADSVIGNDVVVKDCSLIEESDIAAGASVGPFAHLRPGSIIRRRGEDREFRRSKKIDDRRGEQGKPPFLYRRCNRRTGRQHRRGRHHLQLRRI